MVQRYNILGRHTNQYSCLCSHAWSVEVSHGKIRVRQSGTITDVSVVKSVDPSLDAEARRVVFSMPRWIPGKQNGSPVRVKYTVPVTFKLH